MHIYKYVHTAQLKASTAVNELFIFRWSLLSLRTHGCINLFIPSTGKMPLLCGGARETEKAPNEKGDKAKL